MTVDYQLPRSVIDCTGFMPGGTVCLTSRVVSRGVRQHPGGGRGTPDIIWWRCHWN